MVLTEEKQWSYTTASMETANGRDAVEAGLYGSLLSQSRVLKSEVPGWTANTSQFVSKLNSTNKTGPNQLLKVMAGDLLSTNVQYYYQQTTTNSTGSTVFSSVLATLMSSITGSPVTSAATKAASTSIIGNLNSGIPFSQVISPDITSSTGNLPKAYLNLVFFDERFNFVSEGSTSVRVGSANTAANLALTQVKVPKNGYCYVYISNESSVNVFFDNLQVRHDRGRIVEENHYYAFGLKIEPLSSKAFAGPTNNYLYQGDYAEYDDDLGWTDFLLRSYDAQIGRFLQNDPYDQFASGYVGMGNDPGNMLDPTGGFSGGIGCPSVQGLVGYGASVIRSIGSSSLNIANMATTTVSVVSLMSTTFSVLNIFNTGGGGSSSRDNPTVVGTLAHTTLSSYLNLESTLGTRIWLTQVILHSGLKPDIIDDVNKTVWELKPQSWKASNSYRNYVRAKAQLRNYVAEVNVAGSKTNELIGPYRAGGTVFQQPVMNGTTLFSADGRYKFVYSIVNPESGIIFYESFKIDPQEETVPKPKIEHIFVPLPEKKWEWNPGKLPLLKFRSGLPLIIEGLEKLLVPPLNDVKKPVEGT